VFLVLVLEGSGYHLDTLLKWVREVWEFLWEVGVRAVVEVPVLMAVSLLALAWLAAWRVARWELGEGRLCCRFNVAAGLGICCGCFPGFLRVCGVL
jgi:hypothetical protein